MNPHSFQFTLTMPGNARLVGAVRELTRHAVNYAQLPAAAAESMTDDVVTATEAAIASARVPDPAIEFRFDATNEGLCVTIQTDDGSRQICRVRPQVST